MPRPTPSPAACWVALAAFVAGQFMFVVDIFIVNVAIPSMRLDLSANGSEIEAVIAIYQVTYAAVLITGGRLGDIFGRKRVFLIGLAGFTLASAWCGLAQSAPILIVARAAQGATAGLMVPQVLASIQALFGESERPRAFAAFGIALGLGGAVGLMLGGSLVSLDIAHLGWRTAFLINVPVGALLFAAASFVIPSIAPDRAVKLDIFGAALLGTGMFAVLGPALFGRELHWSPWLVLPIAVGVLVLLGFVHVERRLVAMECSPLLDPAWMSDRGFATGLAATFAAYSGFTGFLLVLTLYLQNSLGYTPAAAGLTSGPLAVSFIVASRRVAAVSAERGPETVICGVVIMAVALLILAAIAFVDAAPPTILLAVGLALYGFGQGFVMAPLVNTVLSRARGVPAGAASGILVTVQQTSGAFGIASVGFIYFTVSAAVDDRLAFSLSTLALVIVCAISAFVISRLRSVPTRGTA